jgi:uncharacterized protein YgbK (DUF1537 family)
MNTERVDRAALLAALPPPWQGDAAGELERRLAARAETVVVLDDDPTGTQTVHGVPVLTDWAVETLRAELAAAPRALYILTNTRSMPLAQAQAINREIGGNLLMAAGEAGRRIVVVSRSDSTLRGHFPGELDALEQALGEPFDAWLLAPYFEEGGRYTIGDTHYVANGQWLVPAAATEFAADAVFGYRSSNLRDWVEEKTRGHIAAADVASLSLDDIRLGGPARVEERLLGLAPGSVCVVNAASRRDLEVVTLGLIAAEARGRRFLARSAASFVPVRAGIAPRPLLQPAELALPQAGGALVVVGSYVPTTTRQLGHLLDQPGVTRIEASAERLCDPAGRDGEIGRVAALADAGLRAGADVVVFTSRQVRTGQDAQATLALFQSVSSGLIGIVGQINARPRYILAKGGITSHDLAAHALRVKRALVLGQIAPGVPVWKCGPESRFPDLAYIVFPGNVGSRETLADIVVACRAQ